jgi:hypothetical protein
MDEGSQKGSEKGRKRELKTGTFTVAFFGPFPLPFFSSEFIQYRMLGLLSATA